LHNRGRVKSVAVLLIASLVASPLLADDGASAGEASAAVPPSTAADRDEAGFQASFAESFLAAEAAEIDADLDAQSTEPKQNPPTTEEQPPKPTTEEPQKPAPPKEPPPKRPSLKPADFWKDVKVEAKRYLADSYAILVAPFHWSVADWERVGGAAILIGGLMLEDKHLDHEFQERRSTFTNRVSQATTGFGGGYGVNTGVAFLIVGYVFRSWDVRETGRETLEAGFLSNLLDKWILKRAIGRERPQVSDGRTVFRPGSSNDSFPSGHATEAFAVASVIAMRSNGWVLPTIAYTAATLVAFDRVNDRVHFPSDVAAGAILGTAVGRFLVARHRRAQGLKPAPTVTLVPIRGGLAAKMDF
jgi:membrane-associated phospholipid phosphatase